MKKTAKKSEMLLAVKCLAQQRLRHCDRNTEKQIYDKVLTGQSEGFGCREEASPPRGRVDVETSVGQFEALLQTLRLDLRRRSSS